MHELQAVPIALVGMPGAGKSTLATLLARRLDRSVRDLDDELGRRHGMDTAVLLETVGEPRFRQLEADALAELLESPTPIVVACGGGVVLLPENRDLLRRSARCVWVQVPLEQLEARVAASSQRRPLLEGDRSRHLAELASVRSPLYAEVAEVVVDGTGEPGDIVDRIIEGLAT